MSKNDQLYKDKVVCITGSSRGVGKKLVEYFVNEGALELFDKKEICITTDSLEVIELAQSLGLQVPFVRPSALASDTAGSQEVILHAIRFWEENYYKPDAVVLLQPTSPFRKSEHVTGALHLYSKSNSIDMVVGVKETKANPYYSLREENEMGFLVRSKVGNFTRRQDCPKVFEVNGAVYIINPTSIKNNAIQSFGRVLKYEMDSISSHDIDDEIDWIVAETLIKKFHL